MNVEIVGMVYRDPAYLHSMASEIQKHLPEYASWRIVGNDPSDKIVREAKQSNYPFDVYGDPDPADYYLARVYRCWNYCVETSSASKVILVNSDMMFSPGWVEALVAQSDNQIPVSRLVEPCKHKGLVTSPHGVQLDLGRHPGTFPYDAWGTIVTDLREERVESGGGFMPCLLDRKQFLVAGGYPHGNVIVDNGVAHPVCPNPPRILVTGPQQYEVEGKPFFSGDQWLFLELERRFGTKHVTCYDSLVYHIQEGEMFP